MGKNVTFYLRNENSDFEKESEPGVLINSLLAAHYGHVSTAQANFTSAGIRSETTHAMSMNASGGATLSSTVTPNQEDVKEFKQKITAAAPQNVKNTCPNGHMTLPNGKCMVKDCKYSK